jgi:SAM-dependent methyltransferase
VYRRLVPKNRRVLELGCGGGDLLASLEPAEGVGVDVSAEAVEAAQQKHPQLRFIHADAHDLSLDETFDVIILSDLVIDLWDIQRVLRQVKKLSHRRTRIILNTYSRLWQGPLRLARRLRLASPHFGSNWLTVEDENSFLYLEGLEPVRSWSEILWPVYTPLVDTFCNRFLVRLWPFRHLALSNFVVARLAPEPDQGPEPLVSVIVAARNEAGHIREILERTPELGAGTELIFVEGNSSDDTYETIEKTIPEFPNRRCRLLKQKGKGKGDAVRLGFAEASGDYLMILDADLTVPPEDLPRFYDALRLGRGEFINGVRLVYEMEDEAMRFFNLLGNKFFSHAFSWILGQPIRDTLCGTKVLSRSDYEQIAANRSYFGDFDPFGDFDLLFGAAKLNLRIVDLPIRYQSRRYGSTNISRWRHGFLLLRMTLFAARRLKFV